MKKFLFPLSLFMISITATAASNKLEDKINQQVYLGWSGVHAQEIANNANATTNLDILSKGSIPSLSWLNKNNTAQISQTNFGTKSNPHYLCRSSVAHVLGNQIAHYPGELVNNACEIVGPSAAQSCRNYRILFGNPERTKWVDSKKMISAMQKGHKKLNFSKYPKLGFNLENFSYDINIGGYLPLAGGDEGGNPILVCRAKIKNHFYFGKLSVTDHLSCMMNIQNKIISESKNYNVLFAK